MGCSPAPSTSSWRPAGRGQRSAHGREVLWEGGGAITTQPRRRRWCRRPGMSSPSWRHRATYASWSRSGWSATRPEDVDILGYRGAPRRGRCVGRRDASQRDDRTRGRFKKETNVDLAAAVVNRALPDLFDFAEEECFDELRQPARGGRTGRSGWPWRAARPRGPSQRCGCVETAPVTLRDCETGKLARNDLRYVPNCSPVITACERRSRSPRRWTGCRLPTPSRSRDERLGRGAALRCQGDRHSLRFRWRRKDDDSSGGGRRGCYRSRRQGPGSHHRSGSAARERAGSKRSATSRHERQPWPSRAPALSPAVAKLYAATLDTQHSWTTSSAATLPTRRPVSRSLPTRCTRT